ncbi:MAG: hypothetical protein IKL04_02000 [Lachnospiraceae bacterium]|nr:hypothetical protein [Lachnospiraceae bacterium]
MKKAGQYDVRFICYIVAAFMLIAGMCQSRIEADFCFPCDQNGRMTSFLSASEPQDVSCETSIEYKSVLSELGMTISDSRRESRRSLGRLQGMMASIVSVVVSISVHSYTTENGSFRGNRLTDVLLQYLHNQDGKKRFI